MVYWRGSGRVRFLRGPFDARCFTFARMVGLVAIAQQINRLVAS